MSEEEIIFNEWQRRYDAADVRVHAWLDDIMPLDLTLRVGRRVENDSDLQFLKKTFERMGDQIGFDAKDKPSPEWEALNLGCIFPPPPPKRYKNDFLDEWDIKLTYDDSMISCWEWLIWCGGLQEWDDAERPHFSIGLYPNAAR